jgi:prevent-host-death family protein
MSIYIDMKRVSIAEAKQTLPALVHEAEQRGEVELTRRGKTVAFIVSAQERGRRQRPSFIEAFEEWREQYGADAGNEPLELPPRRPSRKLTFAE